MVSKYTRKINVYIDIENTLSVPFISGIQRVTRELTSALDSTEWDHFNFITVVYCSHCRGWLRKTISKQQPISSIQNAQSGYLTYLKNLFEARGLKSIKTFVGNTLKKHSHPTTQHQKELIPKFEAGSIFLDMDSSWHNTLSRSKLLPALVDDQVNIVTLHHDAIPILFPELTHPHTVKVFTEHFNAHQKHSNLFICNSHATQNTLTQILTDNGASPIKTNVIQFGDCTSFTTSLRRTPVLPENIKRYILYVATVEARKNHSVLLEVFNRITDQYADLGLILLGRPGWLAEKTIEKIENHPQLNNQLIWYQSLDESEVVWLYENAYLNISTSLYEGYGLPVSEGLSHHCVTITSNQGALSEIGGEYVEYFDPRNANQIETLIKRYLDDPLFHQNMKTRIKSRPRRSWDTCATQISDILIQGFSPDART